MMKNLRYLLALILVSVWGGGEIYGQNPEVTLDFTTNDWGLPTDYATGTNTYSNGTYTITLYSSLSNGYKAMPHLILGKKDASLTLPAFNFDVEKIIVHGESGASGKVTQNIFVGETSVSTETTSAKVTHEYKIDENYQAASNIYTLKVTNANNTQITKIEIYKKVNSNLTATSLSFGEAYDNQTFNITEGEEKSFTSPKATLTADGTELSGKTITYSSSDESVANVGTDGTVALIENGFGTATITANFAGDDTYAASSASYTIIYKRKAVEGEITFNEEATSFANLVSGYANNVGNTIFKGNDGNDYTFHVNHVIHNNKALQLDKNVGYIISPEFNFTKGYKVIVTVKTNTITLEGNGESTQGTETQQATLTFSSPASFKISAGSKFAVIESIVVIPNELAYTFNEGNDNIVVPAEGATVSLIRTLDNTDWNTFCVPFDITEEQITEVFGEGTKITDFTSADETKNVMNFTTVTSIKAGEPYLIKPGKEKVENPTFNNVTIVGGEPKTITYGGYSFVGVYSPYAMKTDGTEVFIGTGGKLFVPAETTNKIKGMRAYIRLSNAAQGKMSTISIDGEGTTGISITEKNDMKDNGNVYNINGQLVGKSTTGLKSGIYIVNGKKVIIK